MERQNITLSLPKELLRKAKVIAIERNTSLSGLLAETLIQVVEEEDKYKTARDRHLAWLEQAPDLGSKGRSNWSREELHER